MSQLKVEELHDQPHAGNGVRHIQTALYTNFEIVCLSSLIFLTAGISILIELEMLPDIGKVLSYLMYLKAGKC